MKEGELRTRIQMTDIARSAATERNPFLETSEFGRWFAERREAHRFLIDEIRLANLENWVSEPGTGNLYHRTGRFFSVEGVAVETNFGVVAQWDQPIIVQSDVGILGILVKVFEGTPLFLMQAKMEPGNINMIQLSPTLQATHSNYSRVHQGKAPQYLEYFLELRNHHVVVDTLQSEQGARFLQKCNRNMIVQTEDDVQALPDFQWFTLGQLRSLLLENNVVSMDARTVLGCLPPLDADDPALADVGAPPPQGSSFSERVQRSTRARRGYHTYQELLNWFTVQRTRYFVRTRRVPLNAVSGWHRDDWTVRHVSGRYFSIIACRIEASSREVTSWTQPLLKASSGGLLAFVVKEIDGLLHLLVQAKPEIGVCDQVELAPTVLCMPLHYEGVPESLWPPYLKYVLSAPRRTIRYDAIQSEEGGRFFREENRNVIAEADDEFSLEEPDRFVWMTVRQVREFVRHSHCVNIQARCLLAAIEAC